MERSELPEHLDRALAPVLASRGLGQDHDVGAGDPGPGQALDQHLLRSAASAHDHERARRGLLVRHLVLPENVSGTDDVLAFLAEEVSPDTYVNVMDQYRPCYRAEENPPLDYRITRGEFRQAQARAAELGLHRFG